MWVVWRKKTRQAAPSLRTHTTVCVVLLAVEFFFSPSSTYIYHPGWLYLLGTYTDKSRMHNRV